MNSIIVTGFGSIPQSENELYSKVGVDLSLKPLTLFSKEFEKISGNATTVSTIRGLCKLGAKAVK
jgi:hypothetical protein